MTDNNKNNGHDNKIEDKGRLILAAAVEVFSRKPFHQVKVEDVAAHAGVGKGTVYEYYSSKEELFAAIFEEGGKAYLKEIEKSIIPTASPSEKIEALVAAHLAFIRKQRHLSLLLISEQKIIVPRERHQALLARRNSFLGIIKKIIDEGIDKGVFRPQNSALSSLLIMGELTALWSLILTAEDEELIAGREEEVVNFLLRSLTL